MILKRYSSPYRIAIYIYIAGRKEDKNTNYHSKWTDMMCVLTFPFHDDDCCIEEHISFLWRRFKRVNSFFYSVANDHWVYLLTRDSSLFWTRVVNILPRIWNRNCEAMWRRRRWGNRRVMFSENSRKQQTWNGGSVHLAKIHFEAGAPTRSSFSSFSFLSLSHQKVSSWTKMRRARGSRRQINS